METKDQQKRYSKSFVNFDKVSTSKNKKTVIIHIGQMMVSLNVNYLKKIIENIENPQSENQPQDEV